jgi:hypothetical protein
VIASLEFSGAGEAMARATGQMFVGWTWCLQYEHFHARISSNFPPGLVPVIVVTTVAAFTYNPTFPSTPG